MFTILHIFIVLLFILLYMFIVSFIARKSDTKEKEVENMMMNTEMLTKDLGTILVGEDAVKAGLINEVGGISHAFNKIKELMNKEE